MHVTGFTGFPYENKSSRNCSMKLEGVFLVKMKNIGPGKFIFIVKFIPRKNIEIKYWKFCKILENAFILRQKQKLFFTSF